MPDHLRFAGQSSDRQRDALIEIVGASPLLTRAVEGVLALGVPDCWIVSGAIYNTVWNSLTGRPLLNGIKDVDVFYFDGSDLSYEAEDVVIRRAVETFRDLPRPVEVRNQARVHLWYEAHFGQPCAPLRSSRDAIDHFASRTHAVAIQGREHGELEVYAPFGLDDLFSFRITPNFTRLSNRRTHEAKGARALSVWPELTIVPWDEAATPR
jgi:uncharacterized protein